MAELLALHGDPRGVFESRADTKRAVVLTGGGAVMIALVSGAVVLSAPGADRGPAPAADGGTEAAFGGTITTTDLARPTALPRSPAPETVVSAAPLPAQPAATPVVRHKPMTVSARRERAATPAAPVTPAPVAPARPAEQDEQAPAASMAAAPPSPAAPAETPAPGRLEPIEPLLEPVGLLGR